MARAKRDTSRGFSSTAFLVEALVLLVIVAGVLAVLMSVFAQAYNTGKQSRDEAAAILLASNMAEEFSATPEVGVTVAKDDAHVAYCTVEAQPQEGGVLYFAHIAVYESDEATNEAAEPSAIDAIYQLDTARYVSEVFA